MTKQDFFENDPRVMGIRDDFLLSFKSSVTSLGGEPARYNGNTTLKDMERELAQNGLKFTTIVKENNFIKEIEELKKLNKKKDEEVFTLLKRIDKIKKLTASL